ncbi:beta-1,3-galactosyltransferase 5-like isoform X1 [Lissotriton helveticus]
MRREVNMNRKMKSLLGLCLFTFISGWLFSKNGKSCWSFGCVGVRRQSLVMQSQPLLTRHSTRLTYGPVTYHLNLSQHVAEFPHLQSYNCTLLQDRKGHCNTPGGKKLLLLAVKSHPASHDRRAALRQTWAVEGEVSGYWVKRLFLMAASPSLGHMRLVKEEIKEFQDILSWDFTESHHNLSLKERCFLEWLHHNCKEAEFIFKGDDDVLVNPKALVNYLATFANLSQTLHGHLHRGTRPMRTGKYGVTHSLFPYPEYPKFLSGGGFIMTGDAIPGLYRASIEMPVFPLDDVYLGLLGLAANVTMVHSPRFYTFGLKYNICQYKKALVIHQFSSDQLVKIWQEVQGGKCDPDVAQSS